MRFSRIGDLSRVFLGKEQELENLGFFFGGVAVAGGVDSAVAAVVVVIFSRERERERGVKLKPKWTFEHLTFALFSYGFPQNAFVQNNNNNQYHINF